ncbi:penicillin-binding transpeptidase domain-containing protein [Paenibacillus sacheonensis]|uniref:PASTA domain-containing protein n=1 Tax=Paenibacillus sacheonensis TaxID=742054 RepID=A0A7X5C133_9BACL|nr:penicillin-binding transpeptidase domain-containing protein [Paenibacillus sacheonensis]MBM7565701.1 penicillin-binding protein 2B [Paenibacillus sacheonensis]NBC72241.1 PASTA domain-containing protein [Paenibacillus sacheonensis]
MTKRIHLRTLLVGGVITLLFVLLVGRIYWVQVVKADFWTEKAKEVWARSEKLIPARGTITDRNGTVLAMDISAYTVAVNPKIIHDLKLEDVIVNKLSTVLGKDKNDLRAIIEAKQKNGAYYEQREVRSEGWKIDKELADRIVKFRDQLIADSKKKDVGIYLIDQKKRFYPKGVLASHVLGYEDKEGNAVSGLESSLDSTLRGTEGQIKYEKDGNGIIIANGNVDIKPSVDGKNVKLTIDADIQNYIEDALKEAYDKYQPKSITAIAADPQTMEILGMANLPNFNPNTYWNFPQANFYDHAIKSLYEPGSTFKIVTLAGAVQEGLFHPSEKYKSGSIRVPGYTIHDVHTNWGTITFLEGLKRSSNVAFVKLGYEGLKPDKLMSYINDFGFGKKTGIELGGELAGSVNPQWPSEYATASFGQGKVQVTPIQQVAAVAAVANGGKLLVPHLVKEVDDPVTNKSIVTKPQVIRQAVTEKTADQVDEYLEQVVSDKEIGSGKNAYIEGYRVAGKTGTAQKVINGKYADDKYVLSFIGFAPVGNPKVVLYIVMDEPNDRLLSGGSAVAPIFKQIMQQSLRHLGVEPIRVKNEADDAPSKELTLAVPDVMGKTLSQAKQTLDGKKLGYNVVGTGGTVLKQIPKAGAAVGADQKVYLLTQEQSKLATPNMSGLPLRDAMQMCTNLQLRCIANGEGFVKSQMQAKLNGQPVLQLTLAPPDEEMLRQAGVIAGNGSGDGEGDNKDGGSDKGDG